MSDASHVNLVSRINDVLAMRVTLLVGSIWAFYAFVIFGLTPLFWPQYEEQILYWSNFLQLIFLPVFTVGTAIMSRGTEARAAQDHKAIQKGFALLKEMHHALGRSLSDIGEGVRRLAPRNESEPAVSPLADTPPRYARPRGNAHERSSDDAGDHGQAISGSRQAGCVAGGKDAVHAGPVLDGRAAEPSDCINPAGDNRPPARAPDDDAGVGRPKSSTNVRRHSNRCGAGFVSWLYPAT